MNVLGLMRVLAQNYKKYPMGGISVKKEYFNIFSAF